MRFDKEFIVAVANGEKLDTVKHLTPEQAFRLGMVVRQLEKEKEVKEITG